nr:autotransporter outer membrane beta-barrel domain-containing protein [Bartonella tamiae]
MSYNNINFSIFCDSNNGHIRREDGYSLRGRIGVAFDTEKIWKSEKSDMRSLKPYGIGNLYYEFLDGREIAVTNFDFRNRSDRFWGGLGGGLTYNWNDNAYSLYTKIVASTIFIDFGDRYTLHGTIGFKAIF